MLAVTTRWTIHDSNMVSNSGLGVLPVYVIYSADETLMPTHRQRFQSTGGRTHPSGDYVHNEKEPGSQCWMLWRAKVEGKYEEDKRVKEGETKRENVIQMTYVRDHKRWKHEKKLKKERKINSTYRLIEATENHVSKVLVESWWETKDQNYSTHVAVIHSFNVRTSLQIAPIFNSLKRRAENNIHDDLGNYTLMHISQHNTLHCNSNNRSASVYYS